MPQSAKLFGASTRPAAEPRSRHQHLYDRRSWRRRRADCLRAAAYQCALCGRLASVADHVVPHRGDAQAFDAGELQALCVRCHTAKTARGQ